MKPPIKLEQSQPTAVPPSPHKVSPPEVLRPPAQPPKSIVDSLPALGEALPAEIAAFNAKYAEHLPKPLTIQGNHFYVGARRIHVGDDLATLFLNPATAEQLALEEEERQPTDGAASSADA